MASNDADLSLIIAGIQRCVRERIAEVTREETAKLYERVRQEVGKETDRIAVELLEMYSIERHGSDIRITVKKLERT